MNGANKPLYYWTGNIDDLALKVSEILRVVGEGAEPPTVRLIRDYVQRGLLGSISKSGKELLFTYENLLRFIATRVLLSDGWNLGKIGEHLEHCSHEELEAFLPQHENKALAALKRIRQERGADPADLTSAAHLRRAVALSPLQLEMRDALRRLGLPEDGPPVEAVTLMAIAPWFQALVTTSRIAQITPTEAEEIGNAVTASLLKLARRKEFRK